MVEKGKFLGKYWHCQNEIHGKDYRNLQQCKNTSQPSNSLGLFNQFCYLCLSLYAEVWVQAKSFIIINLFMTNDGVLEDMSLASRIVEDQFLCLRLWNQIFWPKTASLWLQPRRTCHIFNTVHFLNACSWFDFKFPMALVKCNYSH